jgi:hypothetical protein
MSKSQPNRYDQDTVAQLRTHLKDCESISDALTALQERLQITRDHAQRLNRQYAFWGRAEGTKGYDTPPQTPNEEPENEADLPGAPGTHVSFKGDTGVIDLVSEMPKTLDELLAACQVDPEIWEVERYVCNQWQMGRKDKRVNLTWREGVATGFVDDSGKIARAPLWQVKAWLRRKVEKTTLNLMLEQFALKAAKHAPRKWVFERPKRAKGDCCYVLNGQDLHLAKLAWSPETGGADWDINIARKVDDAAVEDLMGKVPIERIDEVIVIVGSDLLQVDNDKSTTTAGTYVDSDSRLAKVYNVACDMLTARIERLASRFKVKAIVIPGNHDSTVSFFLGRYLAAWFRTHPNVEVDSRPLSRKYHGFGKTLLTFDHGDETKIKDLPLIIMRENQATISQYRFMEALTGHLHHEESNDIKGIVLRVAPALCAADKWHARKGLVGSIRRSQGLLYQRENGLEAIYYSTPLD